MAKRIGNILNKIGDLENIYIADSNARKKQTVEFEIHRIA